MRKSSHCPHEPVNIPNSHSQAREPKIELDVPGNGDFNPGLQACVTASERSPSWTALAFFFFFYLQFSIWINLLKNGLQGIINQYVNSYHEGDTPKST